MGRHYKYACTKCGADVGREKLTVKQVVFLTMGERGRRLKARVADWLCDDCRAQDPAWKQDKLMASPGFSDVDASKE